MNEIKNSEEIKKEILACLHAIAPEVDLASLDLKAQLKDQIDLDSLDFMRFITRLHEKMGLVVPEKDYPQFATLESSVQYVKTKLTS